MSQVTQSIKMSNCSDSAEFLHVVFNLIEKHCSVSFSLICASLSRKNACKKLGFSRQETKKSLFSLNKAQRSDEAASYSFRQLDLLI